MTYRILYDDEALSRPLIADNWPDQLREQLVWWYENRTTLHAIVESSELVPSHLDFWPNNLFIDDIGELVPIEWAFYGEGALAEDVANFIPDAVFDGFVAPKKAGESVQGAYGGNQLIDANRQYRNRGLTLSYICDWAKMALAA